MRLIDADALWMDVIHRMDYCDDILEMIEAMPTVEPERKTGTFIGTEYDGYADGNPVFCEWKCSECGCVFEDEEPTYNFCPNCGADMRKES